MPKLLTLKKGREFDSVFRTGIRINGELVRLLYLRDNSSPDTHTDSETDTVKFGCAVGKRQGKAHVRVRGRRILREALRHIAHNLTPGLTLVLTLTTSGLGAKSQDIQHELERLLKRRKLLASQS